MTDQESDIKSARQQARTELEDKYTIDPEIWDDLVDRMPEWFDEIFAIVLIIFGILSFLSIFNVAGDGSIPRAWASAMSFLFGYGSLIISGGILAMGILIVLANTGFIIEMPTRRMVALEVAFLCTLALLHIFNAGEQEMRALARAGRGGGLFGWALSGPVSQLIGSFTVTILYSTTLVLSMGFVIGIKRTQFQRWLVASADALDGLSKRLAEGPIAGRKRRRHERMMRDAAARKAAASLSGLSVRTPILRIRPDWANLPPRLRPGAALSPEQLEDDTVEDFEEHPLFAGAQEGESFNIVGDIVEATDDNLQEEQVKAIKKDDKKYAKRPDGRIKRYFDVGAMDEPKKVGRRKQDLPDLELLRDIPLNRPDEDEINTNVVLIENTLLEFDIDIDVINVRIGPAVTQYAVQPFHTDQTNEKTVRTRISKIASYTNDLALALSAKRLRIEAPVPGTNYVGVEVPNKNPSVVALRSVFESKLYYEAMKKNGSPLFVPLGRDVAGDPFGIDLAAMPHLLVAGTTGSGKSVFIAALTMAIVLQNMPEDVRLIMLDPKMVELARFNGLPHLLGPVETDNERILGVLRWCTKEMDRRYKLLEKHSARNLPTYNDKVTKKDKMPYLVIMIDEVGDLMMSNPDETEHHITRLAQMARAVGMHLVVATQRPSVDVITGLIKANFPGRISFAVASGVDSRVILDAVGAETLLGKGDMLFLSNDAAGPKRVQGCFVNDEEVRAVVRHWDKWYKEKVNEGKFDVNTRGPWEKSLSKLELLSETDDLLEEALNAVINARSAAASLLQKELNIGYPRAARLMDLLYELGAIGPPEPGGKMRKVFVSAFSGRDPMLEMIERRKEMETKLDREEEERAAASRQMQLSMDLDTPIADAPLALPKAPTSKDAEVVEEDFDTLEESDPPGDSEMFDTLVLEDDGEEVVTVADGDPATDTTAEADEDVIEAELIDVDEDDEPSAASALDTPKPRAELPAPESLPTARDRRLQPFQRVKPQFEDFEDEDDFDDDEDFEDDAL